MYQSYYDIVSLDYDVMVLLSVATRQLVVNYITLLSQQLRDMLIIDYDTSAPRQLAYFCSSEVAY